MDLCAEMLVSHCPIGFEMKVSLPKFKKITGWIPSKKAKNFDRLFNRWQVYPEHVRSIAKNDCFFHLVDHSYSHLLHHLPEGRSGVYCHDLDAFKSILDPNKDPRPKWYRAMMGRVFEGFLKARIVFCNTHSTRNSVLSLGIWNEKEVIHAPLGVSAEFYPEGDKELGDYILHVGSCIPRKRIDVLIEVFSRISNKFNNLKLIQAGGTFSEDQKRQISRLNIGKKVDQRRDLTRHDLARLYRGAKLLLVTSDAEGFGLPVIEAQSCGTLVIASDIPALREAGGNLAYYCQVGAIDEWCERIGFILKSSIKLEETKSIYKLHSWEKHAAIIFNSYQKLITGGLMR
jgi:glycosyltransferase involved in cell wall biosynthesis